MKKVNFWEKLENAIVSILKNELVERLVIKFIGRSAGIQFYLFSLVGKFIVNKWGEPAIGYLLREMQAQTIKVDAKIKIYKAEEAKDNNDKDDYFNKLGSI